MTLFVDARVPVLLPPGVDRATLPGWSGVADPDVALLVEGDLPGPEGMVVERFVLESGHVAGCACCLPRSAAAAALGRLFLRRARGEVAFFRRVVALPASEAGLAALWDALRGDAIASGRFRAEAVE